MENVSPDPLPAEEPSAAPESPESALPISEQPKPLLNFPLRGAGAGRNAFATAILYLLFWQITARIPFGNMAVVVLSTLLYLPLALLFIVQTACALGTLRSPKMLAINLLLSGILILPSVLVPILVARFPYWTGWPTIGPLFGRYMHALRFLPGLDGLLLIWLAAGMGVLLSRMVREVKILLPMAVVLAFVDLYVVFGGGLVTQATNGTNTVAQTAMQTLTIKMPRSSERPQSGATPMQLAVGFADFLFIALFFACFARFGIPARQTFTILCGALAGYMLLVLQTGWDLPALVPIALVVIGMNVRQFRYERSEAFALLYAGIIVAAVAGGFYYVSHK